ncbi:uncharacterized protein LOC141685041 [Apium graveolens]|uniref:uncharacterized protein LOC141685041 n=1 Tax=Apium graveolens TaxID=4045 RepID=UPI003D7C0AF1
MNASETTLLTHHLLSFLIKTREQGVNDLGDDCNKESYEFKRFLADAEQPLYEGSDCTKLDSILKLHNWKAQFSISDSAFSDLLSSVGSLLPSDHVLPTNAYMAKKTLPDLGLEYIKIHACPSECILYRGIYVDAVECPKCHISRWKLGKDGKARINIPTKHVNQRTEDGQMRYPADSPSWRNIDYRWPTFDSEPGNIRLALAADVSGPQEPDNNIDVFLEPLIDDLKKFWEEGEPNVYDAHMCGDDTVAKYLPHSKKMCFQGHRRYLPRHHPYRRKNAAFNGEQEFGNARQPLSGEEVKVVDVSKLDKLQSDVVLTLCEHEKIFSPSFFDVMIHLIVHLVRELHLCGPVLYRWMYPFERFNKVLKRYVRNRYHPEGSRTAGLPKDEKLSGPLSTAVMKLVEEKERDEAHLHVLMNNSEVNSHIMMHKELLEDTYRRKKNHAMADWRAQSAICSLLMESDISQKSGMLQRVVQNSGVSVVAKTVQVSSAKDLNPMESDMAFYGIIEEIWELDYHAFKSPLFLYKWADSDRGVKVDDLGFTLVDLSRQGHKNDKYVSVDQVKQVFYIEDPVDASWSVVLTSTTRDYHEVYNDDDLGDTSLENPPLCTEIPEVDVSIDEDESSVGNQREGVEGIWLKR